MRIDKFLAERGFGTRKEIKTFLKKEAVFVNDERVKKGEFNIKEQDIIRVNEEVFVYEIFVYYLLNKPKNVLSATKDARFQTVLDLLLPVDRQADLFPVGRLDKDTTGLLLLTNDGTLAHQLLSPKKHVEKEYRATVSGIVTEETIACFARGLKLNETEWAKPSRLRIEHVWQEKEESEIRLIIVEGKFHQVKRMFHRVGMEVKTLERIRMGALWLDKRLERGEYRKLLPSEVQILREGRDENERD